VTQQPPSLPPPPDDFSPPPPPGGSGYPLPPPPGGSGYPPPPPPGGFSYSPPSHSGSSGPAPSPMQFTGLIALLFSLSGLLTCGFTSIVGLYFGFKTLNRIKLTGESGRETALAAIIIGALILLFVFIAFIYVLATK
jgi:hypothetical protein